MADPQLPAEGRCRCGKVRFRITAAPLLTIACHCTGCQRMSASAYSLGAWVAQDALELLDGALVSGGLHGDFARHQHCDACKSWVLTRFPDELGIVAVRPTMFDDARWFEPFVEIQTDEALPWARLPVTHSYPRFPANEEFTTLIAEYARR